jgi:hypothetical protein
MSLASQKVYVVTSPGLISQINRRHKVIDSNPPFLAVVMGGLFGFHGDDLAELMRNPSESGSLWQDSKVLEHSFLERGMTSLGETFTIIMNRVADRLNTVAREGPILTHLQAWLREIYTLSTAHGAFGPRNPFTRDPGLLDCFW